MCLKKRDRLRNRLDCSLWTTAGSSFEVTVAGQILGVRLLKTKQSEANQNPLLNILKEFALIYHYPVAQQHLWSSLDCWVNRAISSSSGISFDSTVAHGLGFAHSLASNFKGSTLVCRNTLVIRAQVGLNLLPHLLFGVQLLVRFTCNHKVNNRKSVYLSNSICATSLYNPLETQL